jgi:hypothetical protein
MSQKSWDRYADPLRFIVDALRAQDEEQLRRAMQEHFKTFGRKPFPAMPKERFSDSKTVRALLTRMSANDDGRANSGPP